MTLAEFLLARTCSVDGCDRGGKLTRGMCTKHYRYWIDHTPKDARGPAPRFDREFDDFIDRSGSCWLWTGPTNSGGYGFWSNRGERGLAHRIALARATPPPRPGLFACHRCDTPGCVNPRHLYWGTVQDNTDDMLARGEPANQNTRKTHCKRGHALSGDNLRIVGHDRRRQCRTCDNERSRVKMAARRAKARR